MPIPIVCLDGCLRQFVATFGRCFSKPQRKYLVTVLLALLLCQEAHTLSGLLRQVAEDTSLAGLSRFLAVAPWSTEAVVGCWCARFRDQLRPLVEAEHRRQRGARPKGRGRPKATVVTGYLIGDDSTMVKRKGKKIEGLGQHYSTTEGKPVTGHSLVQGLYVLLGRQCPLSPRLYRQKAVCEAEAVPFWSKTELMADMIRNFQPVAGSVTHVLLDSWYTAKFMWRAARERGFLITSGLRSNRWLRVADATAPHGWRWQRLSDYAAGLTEQDYQPVNWPQQGGARPIYAHVLTTRIRKLYRCQLVIVRERLDAPLSEVRCWASSDLQADLPTLIAQIATRWDIEVLFGDAKELLGLDQYQLMSATAIVRFWTLAMAAYLFLDEQRCQLREAEQRHTSPWTKPVATSNIFTVNTCCTGSTNNFKLAFRFRRCMSA